jgi:hypothetical protein
VQKKKFRNPRRVNSSRREPSTSSVQLSIDSLREVLEGQMRRLNPKGNMDLREEQRLVKVVSKVVEPLEVTEDHPEEEVIEAHHLEEEVTEGHHSEAVIEVHLSEVHPQTEDPEEEAVVTEVTHQISEAFPHPEAAVTEVLLEEEAATEEEVVTEEASEAVTDQLSEALTEAVGVEAEVTEGRPEEEVATEDHLEAPQEEVKEELLNQEAVVLEAAEDLEVEIDLLLLTL